MLYIIIILLLIAFILSLLSLRSEIKKVAKPKEVVEELSKGRVVFHASHHA